MNTTSETIELDIDEANELLFKVKVEGIDPAPAKIRLVCEANEHALMFNGIHTSEEGVVQFLLPSLRGKLDEGTHPSRIEVLIENRCFTPVSFNILLKKTVSVVAEVLTKNHRREPGITVSAKPLNKPKLEVESKPREPVVAAVKKSPLTLKEQYKLKEANKNKDDQDGEELLRELARSFVKKQGVR